jgi:probable F420-dependent oxidoreductase
MQFGVIYPQTEYPAEPTAVMEFARTAEAAGYGYIGAYDHVLGANPNRPGGWKGPYDYQSAFLEPFVLFGLMAAVTRRIRFVTGVLILPQRQTAIVAKQAATLDVLSAGRLRLGVGLGWNEVEYASLGQDFHSRGRRVEEQVQVLRRLWTEPLVSFEGRWDRIDDAGLNPLPVQRPIPIWFGGRDGRMIRRAARLGDGWILNYRSPEEARPVLEALRGHLAEEGRGGEAFGIEARLSYGDGDPSAWSTAIEDWRAAGATHISLNTMRFGLATADDHLGAIRRFAEAVMRA